ncbi:ABC transporter ATP-binding protein [Streptomyces sp. NBC_01304]|uniref:ABC transporter ATP-binding protein n=1 Tax=Streptomyces sp. NBC_01304 TaxID=2903818 RepID=UPI002E1037E3|nr:ABC transporter ATP-binding protein [Streptomyces sp. NBC_01304]
MSEQDTALEAVGLDMRYSRRRGPVLRDCTFRIPAGRVCALVGPNGSGKSTLLTLAAGLLRPTSGELRVLGSAPGEVRSRMAYVAQDKPLPPQLSVAETLRFGAELNRDGRWSAAAAEAIAYEHGRLDPSTRIRNLSGGQRTRVALAVAFGKRSQLMLLDEPMADLDPLIRHQLTGALMAEAAEHGTTVVISSHVLPELEGICDHLMLLGEGRIRLAGAVDDLVDAHTLLTGISGDLTPHLIVEERTVGRGRTALVRPRGTLPPDWSVAEPSLEEVVLAHLRNPKAPALTAAASEEAAV